MSDRQSYTTHASSCNHAALSRREFILLSAAVTGVATIPGVAQAKVSRISLGESEESDAVSDSRDASASSIFGTRTAQSSDNSFSSELTIGALKVTYPSQWTWETETMTDLNFDSAKMVFFRTEDSFDEVASMFVAYGRVTEGTSTDTALRSFEQTCLDEFEEDMPSEHDMKFGEQEEIPGFSGDGVRAPITFSTIISDWRGYYGVIVSGDEIYVIQTATKRGMSKTTELDSDFDTIWESLELE